MTSALTRKPRLLDLPHGYQTIIDEEDWPAVQKLTLYRGNNGYAYYCAWRDGRSRPDVLHRLLMQPPKGSHVDHINGDKLDNRRENLRVVTPQQNQINRKRPNRNNKSGHRGVAYRPTLNARNPWHAQITVSRRNIYIGMYATLERAVDARQAAELHFYGELCP